MSSSDIPALKVFRLLQVLSSLKARDFLIIFMVNYVNHRDQIVKSNMKTKLNKSGLPNRNMLSCNA